jgi:hypothetical protein
MKIKKELTIKPKQIIKNVTVKLVAEPVLEICPKCKYTIKGMKNIQKFLERIKKEIALDVKQKKPISKKEHKK